jgi:hypothetical protein
MFSLVISEADSTHKHKKDNRDGEYRLQSRLMQDYSSHHITSTMTGSDIPLRKVVITNGAYRGSTPPHLRIA